MPARPWIVVPVKATTHAKQRLARALPAELRRVLALAMLEDVLGALTTTPGLAGSAVVTIDRAAASLASRFGVRVIAIEADAGYAAAVAYGVQVLAGEGASSVLTLPADVPLVTPHEIGQVLKAHPPSPACTIVPAHHRRGTNAMLCSPPAAVPFRFGDDSFAAHLRAARDAGITPTVLDLPGIGLDLDEPEDLAAFVRRPSATQTFALLAAHAVELQPSESP